jgi:hypothetical protein
VYIQPNIRLQHIPHVEPNRTHQNHRLPRHFTQRTSRKKENTNFTLEPFALTTIVRLLEPPPRMEETRHHHAMIRTSFLAATLLCGPLLGPALNGKVTNFGERRPGRIPSLPGSPRRQILSTKKGSAARQQPRTQRRFRQRLECADVVAVARRPRSYTTPPMLRSSAGADAATTAELEDKIHNRIVVAAAPTPLGNLALRSVAGRSGGRRVGTRSGANLLQATTFTAGDEAKAGQTLATKTTPSLQLYRSERRIRRLSSRR